VTIKIPGRHKGQRICNKYREALHISPEVLEMKQFFSEYDINKKAGRHEQF
jgi:hypothetical protein